jgi:hypothetical protein
MATGGTPTTSSFGLAGTTTTLEMLLPVECGNRMPSGVTVSVLGPSDENVPVDAGTLQVSTSGFTTDVTFTPTTPGGYHIAARFEPNLGLAQYDLIAAADRRDAGFALFTIDAVQLTPCSHVEISPAGRLVCIKPNGADIFDPGSSMPVHLGGVATEYADGVIWTESSTVNAETLIRYVETDAGFVARESGPWGSMFPATTLFPTANDVVVVVGNEARFVALAADGGFNSVSLDTSKGTPEWRDDTVAANLLPAGFMGPTLCAEKLTGGDAGCTTLSGFSGVQLFGMDAAGYYATQSATTGLGSFAYQIGADGSQSLKLPGDWSSPTSTVTATWEHAPILTSPSGMGTDLVLDSSMGLEAYLNDTTEQLGQVCTRFAVVKSGSKARIVPRP